MMPAGALMARKDGTLLGQIVTAARH